MRQTSRQPRSFVKMQAAGNDFVVVDARKRAFAPEPALVRRLGNRRTGIGFDQLLVIGRGEGPAAFSYRIWNADGGEVEQCGNGARCLALLWTTELKPGAGEFVIASAAGPVEARVAAGLASVSMGVPEFAPLRIPLKATSEAHRYTIDTASGPVELGAVSMGNPHAVITVDDAGAAPVETVGPAVEGHAAFPRRANVGFAQVMGRGHLALRVWERGCGETEACGTGACAAVAVLRDRGELDARVQVRLPGGTLVVEWPGRGEAAWLSGPASKVFEGTISL
jgi:diaminopimelate epimerase